MPKQRFYNLPTEKKERILNSAIKEFSRVSINEASINRIIQDANISRGSFYQYFEDKNDLISELMNGYKNMILGKIKEHLTRKDTDIFSLAIELLKETILFSEKDNNQRLCFHFIDNIKNNDDFFHKVIGNDHLNNLVNMIVSLIDTSNFRYSTKEDIINIMNIIFAIGCKTFVNIFKNPENKVAYFEDFKRQLLMLKTGVFKEA